MADSTEAGDFQKRAVDKTLASKAGHAYHEAWAARSALELLPPNTALISIALEGFSPPDERDLDATAIEIADMVRYFGDPTIAKATRVDVVQFKYSIANAQLATRAADIAKTVRKFAGTDVQLRTKHGNDLIERVVRYDYATNRPIHPNLVAAIAAIIAGEDGTGDVAVQVGQLLTALDTYPFANASLLCRLSLTGHGGSLRQVDASVRQILSSWSEAGDPASEKRLLKLRSLIRDKAGPDSEGNNRIDRYAVLSELEVDHEEQLYPAPDSFPPVTNLVARPIVEDLAAMAAEIGPAIVVNAAGGMGKTVLMQSLAERLSDQNHVVLFDGFGAGQWRNADDGRHLPERTLVHLANLLAGQGLCDILLPIYDPTSLVRAFRRRLEQSVATARQVADEAGIVILLDAIDHAALAAEDTGKPSFAHLLLNTLNLSPIPGVKLICSCRTERLALAAGGESYRSFVIPPFSQPEARALIALREPNATAVEIAALEMRSGLNPRCLDTLLTDGRPFDIAPIEGQQTATSDEVLDALLRKRVESARETARSKGATDAGIDLLLTALSILPPPVPMDELAAAHRIQPAQVESFVADLTPLLERTPHGLMFRDEPTETLIRAMAATNDNGRDHIVATLEERQSVSNYAARALPSVLTALKHADKLVALAFDERVPLGASKVSLRDIRLARIISALEICARTHRFDDLLRVLLEAAIVAGGQERSDRLLYEHPDLAAASGDSEALRRLFATKAGWPGGRHAALALAHAMSGDMDQARIDGRRAIGWYNWNSNGGKRAEFNTKASYAWDDIGFTYVEMLADNELRVASFFDRRTENVAFAKFSDLLDLLERHAILSGDAVKLGQIRARIDRCRLPSRALYAAALKYRDENADRDKHLVRKLAKSTASEGKADELIPGIALLAAACRAFGCGLRKEARAILTCARILPPSVHDFSSYWPIDRDHEHAVIQAGINAALRGRPATLVDLAPSEFLALVPQSVRKKGPAAFSARLNEELRGSSLGRGSKPRKLKKRDTSFDGDRYRNALDHRITPLIPFANAIARLLSGNADIAPRIFEKAIIELTERVATAQEYPYQDGKSFVAKTGFATLFAVADAIDAIDKPVADKIATWLKSAPGFYTPVLIEIIDRLSRRTASHDACLAVAAHAETRILSDTDTSSRISSYGALARAVWRVSPDEASAYFRRALDLADAVGSDDFDRTNHLLELTSRYRGLPLTPPAAYSLARILELNQSEDGKFPWIEYAQTMVPVAGMTGLAIISRLDDRRQARLSLSLGPMLTQLAKASLMPPDIATSLFGLASPGESWTWRMDAFAKAVLADLPEAMREWLFEIILVELDRDDQLLPWRETIDGLLALGEAHLASSSPSLIRMRALAGRRRAEEAFTARAADVVKDMPVFTFDVGDTDAIDRTIADDLQENTGKPWPELTLTHIAAGISTPNDRIRFLRALVHTNAAKLAAKLRAIEDYLPAWRESSASLRDALPGLALELASKHALELVGHSWETDAGWRALTRTFDGDRAAIAERIIATLGPTATEIGGDSWLALAAKIAPKVSDAAFAEGLERHLTLSGSTIPVEVGDGPWREGLAIGGDAVVAAAGLVWSRLGHFKASARWRAAHAIRRLCKAGRGDVVAHVVALYDIADAGAFGSSTLPFYPMHARLWLLIALARIAKDFPDMIAPHRAILEGVAFDTGFPHVVMRAFAKDALSAILPLLGTEDAETLRTRLASVNASPFVHEPRDGFGTQNYENRPEGKARADNEFHLDYEFGKYQSNRLSDTFGAPGWEIEDAVSAWVRKWDGTIRAMYDCPRLASDRYDAGSWSSGSMPPVDRYGGYLGWHALMLVAGEMLATRPVTGRSWDGDAWADFLKEYRVSRQDGLWLADVTDLFPLDLPLDVAMPDNNGRPIEPKDHALLLPLALAPDASDRIVVKGSMSLPSDVTIHIQSVIAGHLDAKATVYTMLTDPKFFRWLPDDAEEISRHFRVSGHTVRALLRPEGQTERQLDRLDPYATTTAMRRPLPAEWVATDFDVSAGDHVVRNWVSEGTSVFSTEAWGAEGGRDEAHWDRSGERIAVTPSFLMSLLRAGDDMLVLAIKTRWYVKGTSTGRAGDTSSFLHRSTVFTLDKDGNIWTPKRIPSRVKKAVASLEASDRREFSVRFPVIRAALIDRYRR
jgi:hypothetical protein